jgi:M6 family metalloprotease-like protein
MAQATGTSNGLGDEADMLDYLTQALTAADEYINWTQFDNDGPDGRPDSGDDDGLVDAVAFEFLEIAASCGGPSIWPHRSSYASWNNSRPFFTKDIASDGVPMMVNGYIVQGVTDCAGEEVQSAGTIAHEYGHVLGFPDFYHATNGSTPEYRKWVLGCWELMAAGSWGCGKVTNRVAFGPTHMMAAQKEALGWATFDRVEGEVWNREYVLDPIETSGRALLVPLDGAGIESLILEYRTKTGFDKDLPAEGVLITHRDLLGELRPRTGFRYRQRLLEADGNDALVHTYFEGGDRGDAGDAFGADGLVRKLNAFSLPQLIPNATGRPTTVAIHSITISGGKARVRISTGATPRVAAPTEPIAGSIARPFGPGVLITGGLMPYSVQQVTGVPPGVEVMALGDQILLRGAPRQTGAFQIALRLGDARGSSLDVQVPVNIQAFFVEQARLLQTFLGSGEQPLAAEERAYLDAQGNANGAFDVGDVRAWLRKN